MKTLFISIALVFSCLHLTAQECEIYSPLTEGTFLELTEYNAKGKATGRTEHKVLERTGNSGLINAIVFDKKDKELINTKYTVECREGGFYVQMATYLDMSGVDSESNFDVEMDGDFLKFPPNMSAGDRLDDGEMTAEVKMGGATFMRLGFTISNRKVEALETIKTPAGEFDCVKISFDFDSKAGFIKVKGSATEWVSKDIGVVRSESFNKKGKLTNYVELTKYQK